MHSAAFLTPEEVAGRLGVSRRTVYRWIKSGRVRAWQAGSLWRIEPMDLDRFLVPNNGPISPHVGQERLTDEQAERAIAYLQRRLEEPPDPEGEEGYPLTITPISLRIPDIE